MMTWAASGELEEFCFYFIFVCVFVMICSLWFVVCATLCGLFCVVQYAAPDDHLGRRRDDFYFYFFVCLFVVGLLLVICGLFLGEARDAAVCAARR